MAETMRQSDVLAMLVTDSVSQYRQKCFTSVRRPILTLGQAEKASQKAGRREKSVGGRGRGQHHLQDRPRDDGAAVWRT